MQESESLLSEAIDQAFDDQMTICAEHNCFRCNMMYRPDDCPEDEDRKAMEERKERKW